MTKKVLQQLLLGRVRRTGSSLALQKFASSRVMTSDYLLYCAPVSTPYISGGCHSSSLLSFYCYPSQLWLWQATQHFLLNKKKACSEPSSYSGMRRLSVIFPDHSLSAYIECVSYSDFIQVLKRLLKSSHDCQIAEQPLSHAQAICVWVSAYPSTLRATTGRKLLK